MCNTILENLKLIYKSFISVFYINQKNSLELLNFYLNSSLMIYGRCDHHGIVRVSRNRLTLMHIMAFSCLVEIVKEFSFITNLCSYNSIIRVIFIDCSVLFPSMRYYYVILHSALSMPYCFIFLYFWTLNLRYFYATKTSIYFLNLRIRLNKLIKNKKAVDKLLSYRTNRPQHLMKYFHQQDAPLIVKQFNFRFARFMTINSINQLSKEYQIHRKYLLVKLKVLRIFQTAIYSISKIGISSWCITVIYTSLFFTREKLSTLIYLCLSLPITVSHIVLFLIGATFSAFTFYLYVSTSVMAILQIVCCMQRIDREYLNSKWKVGKIKWSSVCWICRTYMKIMEDIENFNFFFNKIFAFLFLASSFYACFQFAVIFFTGFTTTIAVIVTNTSFTLFFMSVICPSLFSGFINLWVGLKISLSIAVEKDLYNVALMN